LRVGANYLLAESDDEMLVDGRMGKLQRHVVAPGGPPEGQCEEEWISWREEVKLHAVAPGGPPEGQCEMRKK
jgi:hypothetical protein